MPWSTLSEVVPRTPGVVTSAARKHLDSRRRCVFLALGHNVACLSPADGHSSKEGNDREAEMGVARTVRSGEDKSRLLGVNWCGER